MRVHVYIRATKCTIIYHHQTVLKQTNKKNFSNFNSDKKREIIFSDSVPNSVFAENSPT